MFNVMIAGLWKMAWAWLPVLVATIGWCFYERYKKYDD